MKPRYRYLIIVEGFWLEGTNDRGKAMKAASNTSIIYDTVAGRDYNVVSGWGDVSGDGTQPETLSEEMFNASG